VTALARPVMRLSGWIGYAIGLWLADVLLAAVATRAAACWADVPLDPHAHADLAAAADDQADDQADDGAGASTRSGRASTYCLACCR
jgi:hypothetical protein